MCSTKSQAWDSRRSMSCDVSPRTCSTVRARVPISFHLSTPASLSVAGVHVMWCVAKNLLNSKGQCLNFISFLTSYIPLNCLRFHAKCDGKAAQHHAPVTQFRHCPALLQSFNGCGACHVTFLKIFPPEAWVGNLILPFHVSLAFDCLAEVLATQSCILSSHSSEWHPNLAAFQPQVSAGILSVHFRVSILSIITPHSSEFLMTHSCKTTSQTFESTMCAIWCLSRCLLVSIASAVSHCSPDCLRCLQCACLLHVSRS